MNGGRSVATRIDRLCAIDHDILGLLRIHRVLTTPQLITLTQRPERTIDYRLTRLRERALIERTRPYAASGSAPFFWWLTRTGGRLVEGTSPAPGKGTPNPLFLRHTAAIAGLYVALSDVGPSVGLTFATMDQARLRAKVARHRSYCKDTVWWDRHPCCPALLLVTTSEARVNRFLAGVEKDRPRPSPYNLESVALYSDLSEFAARSAEAGSALCRLLRQARATSVLRTTWRAPRVHVDRGGIPARTAQPLPSEEDLRALATGRDVLGWTLRGSYPDRRRAVGGGERAEGARRSSMATGGCTVRAARRDDNQAR